MTLDPTAMEGIAELAQAIQVDVDDSDHDTRALAVWHEWLDPLVDADGRRVVEPLGEQQLRALSVETAGLIDDPFPTTHGLDSGTINPTTFKNGLVLDLAQAAMGREPTDLNVHRHRSLVATVHSQDASVDHEADWRPYDDGYGRWAIVQSPRVSRFAEGVVHALALYYAESEHALEHADHVEDLLVLDGPLYPKGILSWTDRAAELDELTEEAKPRQIVGNYVDLVERFVERDVPLMGFVKNPASKHVTRVLREKAFEPPWVDDTAMFVRLLEQRDDRGERVRDELTFTSWLVSRGGTDGTMAADRDHFGVDRQLDPSDYEVAFFVVYDPREDVLFRVETPVAFAADETVRERLTQFVLREVALNRGPPTAVEKADALARISREEKRALREIFERTFDADLQRTYDDVRWDPTDE
jgi:hypothetical protein